MTRQEIIRLAREAGISAAWPSLNAVRLALDIDLERFASLVAAAERARTVLAAFEVSERQIAAEREACARLAESPIHRHEIAEKIRARGQDE